MPLGKIIRELGVKVGLAFDKAAAEAANKKLDEVSTTLRGVSLRVAEVSGALFGFAKAASANARELAQYGEQLGINVERLQELEYGAKVVAGVSRDELMGALQGVSATLDNVRRGNLEAAQTFNRLGIGMDIVGNRSLRADQVLMAVADRIKDVQDPIARTAIVTEIFGGAGAKLIPLLKKGSEGIAAMGTEGRKLGVVIGKGLIDEGREFDRTLSRLWIVVKNVTFTIGHELLRYLFPLIRQWQAFIVQNKRLIASGIAAFMKALSYYVQIVFKWAKFLVERLQYLVSVLGGLEKVTKAVAIAFGIIASARIMASLGGLIGTFNKIGSVLGAVNLKAALLSSAFLAVILIAQDFFSKDSIIKEWFAAFESKFPNLAGMARDFVSALSDGAKLVVEGWKLVWALFDDKAPVLKEMATGLLNAAESAAKWVRSGAVGDKLFDAVEYFKGLGGAATSPVPGATPTPSPGAAGAGNQKNQFTADIAVTVPAGTSPKTAVGIVSDGVQEAFDSMLRHARNQAVGGVAY